MGEGKVTTINNKEEWTAIHQKAGNKAVIVDFSATWCGPCRMISPYFEELSTKHTGATFIKVDVDAVEAVAQECGISAMPTFQVWKGGQKVDELVGASKDKLNALVEKHV
ncbi:hypothetical protein ABBQ38_010557 [Trebouxia sp. C0009 RCD-2024]